MSLFFYIKVFFLIFSSKQSMAKKLKNLSSNYRVMKTNGRNRVMSLMSRLMMPNSVHERARICIISINFRTT